MISYFNNTDTVYRWSTYGKAAVTLQYERWKYVGKVKNKAIAMAKMHVPSGY